MDPRPPPLLARSVVSRFAASVQQAQRVLDELGTRPLRPSFGRVVHANDSGARGGQVARGWSDDLDVLRQNGTAPLLLPARRTLRRRPVVAPGRGATGDPSSIDESALTGGEEGDHGGHAGSPAPPPADPLPQRRVRSARPKMLVEDYVVDTLAACIRRTCGLPSRRQMGKHPSPVTARVVGDPASRSRAIVLRSGAGKADLSILWVSCRDGILCSCFGGTQNALFLSVSSRSTTCKHTAALVKALRVACVSLSTFRARMRLRADSAEYAVFDVYGQSVVWAVLYHAVYSVVTFTTSNVATCIAPGCRRFRGRCGHVRVARDAQGPEGFNHPDSGSAPAVVEARKEARKTAAAPRSKMLNNEEEDEGLEGQAGDTVRGPRDIEQSKVAQRTPRNMMPCAAELDQGAVWARTADWRGLILQRSAGRSENKAAHVKLLGQLIETSQSLGDLRNLEIPLVEPFCGSCGHERADRHKITKEPGLLVTHHPTAPPLRVRCLTLLC